ncbi:DBH-like monooxygenase protein 1 [Centruroides sculpturatus]|uniref:DBH-like monooxygenase protein 1 n=1 Tax=Centruroides sculpturatus TaxID=218467 RepID=UPI000C6CF83D|nr:DBH-like monooxygenase protein 1 [Centruroides sculpturatus]
MLILLGLPPEGVKVFAVLFHSHLLGKKLKLRHFRGNELPPISKDDNYDNSYQDYRLLENEVTILPDDHLILECTYNSIGRTKPTFGGFTVDDEICLSFIMYYPSSSLVSSFSCPSPFNVLISLGVIEMSQDDRFVISPITGKNETYFEFLNTYPWDEYSVNAVQRSMKNSPHLHICMNKQGKPIHTFTLARYPFGVKSYEEPDICKHELNFD